MDCSGSGDSIFTVSYNHADFYDYDRYNRNTGTGVSASDDWNLQRVSGGEMIGIRMDLPI